MKIHNKMIVALILFMSFSVFALPGIAHASSIRKVDRESFRMLDRFGEWKEVNHFGLVWRPWVVSTWRPFFYGDWISTPAGWEWVSYEPFGWLVFHYGHWYFENDIGWFWIPGSEWSAAPVSWYDFDDYVAWAPLPPPGFFWPDPWFQRTFIVWNVVFVRDFDRKDLRECILTKIPQKPKTTSMVVQKAPDVRTVERVTKRKIETVQVSRDKVQMGKQRFERSRLPADISKRVEEHKARMEREVLRPRPVHPMPTPKPPKK